MKKTLTSALFISALTLQVTHSAITDGLIAHYTFNGNANDVSGNGQNATIINAPLAGDRFGNLNSTYSFNGSGNVITGNPVPVANNFTFSLWFKANALDNLPTEAASGIHGFSQRYAIFPTYPGENSGVGISIGTNGLSVFEHGAFFLPAVIVHPENFADAWTQAVVTVLDDGAPNLFINGVHTDTGLITGRVKSFATFFNSTTGIGGGTYGNYNGLLDDIRVYNRALSASEVGELYSLEVVPEPSISVLCSLFALGWTLKRRR